jgi:HlyD family secretion protein
LQAELHGQLAKDGLISTLALKVSESQAEELTTRYQIEKERLEINNEAVVAQLAAQQARVDQHKAMARLKQAQLDSLRVRAGTRGVLALLPVEVGQQVAPGANLARVANPERLKAEIKIPETQAKDVQIGQLAAVDTHNGIIAGRVARMDATVLEGSVTVDVVLEEALPKGARPELSVDGTIELERLENVLHVARPAFGQGNSQVSLFRLLEQGNRAARVRVQFGRTSVNLVEILEGLNEGDQVIVSDMSAWDSFDQVRID